jgi:hypothetical protein
MEEIEKELKEFFDYWYKGFLRGIENIDETSRNTVLHNCGKACAESYTVQIFKELKLKSSDIDTFLQILSNKGSGSSYIRIRPNTIKATYFQCGCDLVRLGLIESPNLCECSAANLKENLEQSLNIPVSVKIETSILRGGKQCILIAEIEGNPYQ